MRPARAALLAGLAAAIVALPSLRNDFVEDDLWVLRDRRVLVSPPSVTAVLTEPYWPRGFGGRLWRPLVLASWALDYRVSHSPHWFHAVNIAWAALAAGLLALLAAELGGGTAGLIAGLLFAVHPVHVEATSSIVGRCELMAGAGYALAVLCALRAERSRFWLLGTLAGSALAIGSKEHAVTLPVVLALGLLWKGRSWREITASALVAAAPVILYFVLRGPVAGGALDAGGMAPGLEGLSMAQRTIAMTGVSLEWWRLLLFPLHLSSDWSTAQVAVSPLLTPRVVATFTLWIVAGIGAWGLRRRAPGAWLGLAWFVLTIGPVANVLVPTEIVLAERTLYLPSWGIIFAIAALAVAAPWPRLAAALLVIVGVLFGVRAVLRNEAWRDSDHARAAMLRDAPKSYRSLWIRGNEAFAAGRPGTGEQLMHQAMLAAPGIPGPIEDLAGYYSAAGLKTQAEDLLRNAMALNTSRTKPWMMMQDIEVAAHDTAAAVRWALKSTEQFPRDPDVINRALGTLLVTRKCEEASMLLGAHAELFSTDGNEQARRAILNCRRGGGEAGR